MVNQLVTTPWLAAPELIVTSGRTEPVASIELMSCKWLITVLTIARRMLSPSFIPISQSLYTRPLSIFRCAMRGASRLAHFSSELLWHLVTDWPTRWAMAISMIMPHMTRTTKGNAIVRIKSFLRLNMPSFYMASIKTRFIAALLALAFCPREDCKLPRPNSFFKARIRLQGNNELIGMNQAKGSGFVQNLHTHVNKFTTHMRYKQGPATGRAVGLLQPYRKGGDAA